jgi:hypothetical protein
LQFTTPEFGAVLKKEWAYSKGEVGHLDYDPWLGAQDGEIGKPVRFSVESESPDVAVVSMSYPFVLDPKHPPERHTVHLVLRKRGQECWHLHDFITPLGESLSYLYSAAQPQTKRWSEPPPGACLHFQMIKKFQSEQRSLSAVAVAQLRLVR